MEEDDDDESGDDDDEPNVIINKDVVDEEHDESYEFGEPQVSPKLVHFEVGSEMRRKEQPTDS